MLKSQIPDEIYKKLGEYGYQGKIVPSYYLEKISAHIQIHYKEKKFNDDFYQEEITWLNSNIETINPDVKSVIIVSVPTPQTRIIFNWNNMKVPLLIPPHYRNLIDHEVKSILEKVLKSFNHQINLIYVPLKLLAVYSGLGKYGRNNLCYIPSFGSFHRLMAYSTDFVYKDINWQIPQLMKMCEKCTGCLKSCPTGAISSDRFLLHAERCLTYLNEKPSSDKFPDWIDSSWHNSFIGCLHCQTKCPKNKQYLHWIENGIEFTEEETKILLKGVSLSQLPAITKNKLENIGMLRYINIFPRNLGFFLEKFDSELHLNETLF
ncbi:MAG: 4Fe-4S double cluster binding domain-containing protein [Candidatus Hodarchaeales archaeon]|jgi:epoxyqueuosine reductase